MARGVARSVRPASGTLASRWRISMFPQGPARRRVPEATAGLLVTRKGGHFPLGSLAGGGAVTAERCNNGAHDEHDVHAALRPCRDVLAALAGKRCGPMTYG